MVVLSPPHRLIMLRGICLALAGMVLVSCAPKSPRTVVVYASQDQVYAEPILREFSRTSGIKVRTVYDSEAVKTVGLVVRLINEKSNPQCDVFWNNEAFRTRQLEERGVVEKSAAFGSRSRRVVINTNLVSLDRAPSNLSLLTNSEWRGKLALAYPLFGSTATHFIALRQHWGAERWEGWCRALQANKPFLLEGNSVVVRFVGRGEAWIGLTDSDDIAAAQRAGLPVAALPLAEESLLIPNTVAIIRGARHADEALELFNYLQSPPVIQRLMEADALESSRVDGAGLKTNWDELVREADTATKILQDIFLRK
jgi:iron(III) transport system substrate-binding protein